MGFGTTMSSATTHRCSIGRGADMKIVQRLRHASATTTLNTYSHLWPDADESARAAGGVVLAARADSSVASLGKLGGD